MSYESYKYTFRINASHSMVSAEAGVHSHTFEITLYLRPDSDAFSAYDETESVVNDYLKPYTGMLLNKVPPFDTVSPTLENMGELFFAGLSEALAGNGNRLLRLEISENPRRVYSVAEGDVCEHKRIGLEQMMSRIDRTAAGQSDHFSFAIFDEAFPSPGSAGSPGSPGLKAKDTAAANSPDSAGCSYTVPKSFRPASNWSFILSVLFIIVAGYAVMIAVKASGLYPLGFDIYGHLFKTDLLYGQIRKGNFYPLYTEYWYNGLQPFRYWPPVTYYFMALLQLIGGGDVMNAYLGFIWASFAIGGIGWVLFAKRLGRPVLGAFFGLFWFFLPDNLRVFFGEGNLARVFITMLLPYILYCLWQFVCYRRKRMIIPLILLMITSILTHLMISAMVGVACAIFLLIYAIANKSWRESVFALLAMLFSFAAAGIWVCPALVGGLASMASDGTAALMASLSAPLSTSLNPFLRLGGGVTGLYFGLSIALTAFLGLFLSNRKSLPGFCSMIIVIMGTTTALTPLVQLLPMSQLFWVRRFAPVAYAMFVVAVLEWRNLKRPILIAMCAAIALDCVPSVHLADYDSRMNLPATVGTVDATMDEYLISKAQETTVQRVSLMDLSSLGPMPSYAFGSLGEKTQYVFGWAWQGAATASNIAYLNEALEKKNYLYVFDRNLELGADSVLIEKGKLAGTADREALVTAARRVGYSISGETGKMILFSLGTDSTFGVISEYSGLAIGTTAALVPGILPSFRQGDKVMIDDYTVEELTRYDMIYLSGFFYNNKEKAESIVRAAAGAGVEIYVDMSRIPADPLTNRMTFLDVSAQPITFLGSYPDLVTPASTTKALDFADGYEKWNTVYLTGLTESGGYAWFEDTKLDFVGTGNTPNITYLGFNLLFHAYTVGDDGVKAVLNSLMELDEDRLPERTVVPLQISYGTNSIVIRSDYDDVNTTIAWQDTFRSSQDIRSMNNFLIVDKGTTVITMEYPYWKTGTGVSAVGLILEAALLFLLFRKPKAAAISGGEK